MSKNLLASLESQASTAGLMLRVLVRRPLNLWTLRVVVAKYVGPEKVQLLGEMKGWAYRGTNGLQLDTIRVNPTAPLGIGYLLWASTMAWALEETPCRIARLLAVLDDEHNHLRLINFTS